MLVLSRKAGETIHIDGQIKVTVVKISRNCVRVGIEAPDSMNIVRGELIEWNDLPFDDAEQAMPVADVACRVPLLACSAAH